MEAQQQLHQESSMLQEEGLPSRDNTITCYRNCLILREGELKLDDIWVRNGRILDPMSVFFNERLSPDVVYECRGLVASPGFIDLQVNGAKGYDFSSFSSVSEVEKGLTEVSKALLQHGVTGYCPTIVTSSADYYNEMLPHMRKREGGSEGAAILGVHAEGPFISTLKKGAHEAKHIVAGTVTQDSILATYGSLDNIIIMTLAPELPGCMEVLPWLQSQGIKVSLGHSMSSLATAEEAVRIGGVSLITHLFNAMLPFHHRDPGIVGLLTSLKLQDKQIYYSIIPDGHHTEDTVLRIAQKSNPQGVVLVTDALSVLCVDSLSGGPYRLGETMIEVKGNKACIAGTDSLAGGYTPMNKCVLLFENATDCGLPAALEAVTLHPATALGIQDRKGHLGYGADADIVFLTPPTKDKQGEGLEVAATIISGEFVYQSKEYKLERVFL